MRVSEFMTRKVVTAAPADGIRETFFRMREAHIRHLPVLERKRVVVEDFFDAAEAARALAAAIRMYDARADALRGA